MGAQFTPGPWAVSAVSHTEVIGPKQRTICRAHRDAPTRGEDETRANANLIAAAPDLFEALERCRARLLVVGQIGTKDEVALNLAHAALAKARGDQS